MADSYADNVEPLYDTEPGAYLHVQPDEVVPDGVDNPMYFEKSPGADAGGTGYMAVEPDWLSEQWDLLSEQPWFRGFQNRDESETELLSYPPGGFVVRVSVSEPGHYAISCIQHGQDFDHMLILPSRATQQSGTSAPGNTRYRLGTHSKDLFNTVPKLVAYYIDHAYIDERRLQGHVLAETQAGGYKEVNPTAPSWIRGEISRVKSEDLLAGALPGQFVLRTKRGQGHVLSMVLPEEYDNKFRHHLIKAESGDFFIDKFGVGKHRSVENLISLLQTDTLGVLACPLQMAEFEEPTFEDHFNEPAGYDTAAGAGYETGAGAGDVSYAEGVDPLYDSAADGQGAMYQDVAPEDPYADDAQINGGDPLYEEGVNYNTGGDPLYSDTPNAYTGGEALYDEAADAGPRKEGDYGEALDLGLDGN